MPELIDIENIDDQFIDVDFEQDPNYVFGDTGVGLFGDCGVYEDLYGVMSESEIDAAIERNTAEGINGAILVSRIYNQLREGSCVANACAQAHEMVQAAQYGKANVIPLSAISLYKRIGRSPSSGAMVSDGLKEGHSRGILPLDTPENRARFGSHVMPNTGFHTAFPANWQQTANQIIYLEYDIIRTIAGLQTALVRHQPVVVGRQGHSITYADLTKRSGRRIAPYPNSWGNWGSAYAEMTTGFGFDTVAQMQQSARWAFTVRAVRVPERKAV